MLQRSMESHQRLEASINILKSADSLAQHTMLEAFKLGAIMGCTYHDWIVRDSLRMSMKFFTTHSEQKNRSQASQCMVALAKHTSQLWPPINLFEICSSLR